MNNVLKGIICFVVVLVLYYFMLPALNLSDPDFWSFVFISLVICFVIWVFGSISEKIVIKKRLRIKPDKKIITMAAIAFSVPVLMGVINLFNAPLFRAESYYKRIRVTESNFTSDVKQIDFSKLALLDKDSSRRLGDKVMGQMTDLVSQFEVSDLYTQINYKEDIVRVTPLEYANFIKYFTNRSEGVEGYITVNSVSGEAELVRLEDGMKYMPSSMFFEDLYRKLRISYPTTIFGAINFEIDEDGKPYWIAETIKYSGIGLKKEVSGVVIFNPIDGSSVKYKAGEIPSWVDHVYSSDLVMEQLDDWGKYKNGFFNSIFGQKEVTRTTAGYNYIAMNDDIYMYTGITSVSHDASNIGFVLTNLRTKETHFYNVAGAEETAAMASAEGQVQQMNYTSTFPLLINLDGKPTYLVSLKDNAGLVKMYAFVDYTDYQKVVVTDASAGIEKAAENYLGGSITPSETLEKVITVTAYTTGVVGGNTYYYIKDDEEYYKVRLSVDEKVLPFMSIGDKLHIVYKEADVKEIVEIKKP